eukprot:1160953-Pelagomonas_calceolata.AAC.4
MNRGKMTVMGGPGGMAQANAVWKPDPNFTICTGGGRDVKLDIDELEEKTMPAKRPCAIRRSDEAGAFKKM